jgi:hypothetical protein
MQGRSLGAPKLTLNGAKLEMHESTNLCPASDQSLPNKLV